MISESQANIFKKLYTQTANQNHVRVWVKESLTHQQASPIIARIIKLDRNLSLSDPEKWIEIQSWGRAQVKELGYQEKEFNKAL